MKLLIAFMSSIVILTTMMTKPNTIPMSVDKSILFPPQQLLFTLRVFFSYRPHDFPFEFYDFFNYLFPAVLNNIKFLIHHLFYAKMFKLDN